jgi:hypothetical protein
MTEIRFEEMVVKVKPRLSLEERAALVQEASDMVFAEDAIDIDGYLPVYKRFAIRYALIKHFTDYDLPAALAEVEQIVFCSGLLEQVAEVIGNSQSSEIIEDIDEVISARKEALIRCSITSKMVKAITNAVDNLGKSLEGIDVATMLDTFSKMSGGDMGGLFKSLLGGG